MPNDHRSPLGGQISETKDSFRKECLESYFCGCLGWLSLTNYTGGRAEGGVQPAEKTPEVIYNANRNYQTERWVTKVLRKGPLGGKPVLFTRNNR